MNRLQVVAVQVWRVRDQLVLDMNFWDLVPSALKLPFHPSAGDETCFMQMTLPLLN